MVKDSCPFTSDTSYVRGMWDTEMSFDLPPNRKMVSLIRTIE